MSKRFKLHVERKDVKREREQRQDEAEAFGKRLAARSSVRPFRRPGPLPPDGAARLCTVAAVHSGGRLGKGSVKLVRGL